MAGEEEKQARGELKRKTKGDFGGRKGEKLAFRAALFVSELGYVVDLFSWRLSFYFTIHQ